MTARPVVLIAGKDPTAEPGGGHSVYVRAHARAAALGGREPHLFCVAARSGVAQTDFGILHRVASPVRPFRQLAVGGHGPFLARAVAEFVRSSPHVAIHGFGAWSWAARLAGRTLRAEGRPAAYVVGSYTILPEEIRSRCRGLTPEDGAAQRIARSLEGLWVDLAVSRLERAAYRGAHAILVNYDSVARLVKARYGASLAIRRLPYASESAFLAPPAAAGDGSLPDLPAGEAPLIVSLSRHDPRKGVDVLLHALALLASRGVAFRACLLGTGELLETHRALCARLGLSPRVRVTGLVPDPAPYLSRADLFALPSREEQSGSLALLEALSAGVPVVASSCDGIPEDVTDGVDALLVPPGDPESLAAALGRLLADERLRRRLGEAGRRTAEQRFSPGAMSAALAGVYEEMESLP